VEGGAAAADPGWVPAKRSSATTIPKAPVAFSHRGLLFRPVETEDLDAVRRLRNDESTWVHLSDPRILFPADQEAWLRSLGARAGKFFFVASDALHPFVGLVRMDEFDPLNRSIRVGADVVPELRRQGFGRRIFGAIKKYCFDFLNVHRVWLLVLESNEAARGLYRKEGFRDEGVLRDAVFRGGKYVHYVSMSLLESEYRGTTATGGEPA